MSDTPRTDKEAFDITTGEKDVDGVVMADFARELERELHEQCVVNGKGSEREAVLLGRVECLERENARLQMELDGSCNAEELRQVRAENAALRADKERLDWLARNRSVSATERPLSVTPESLRASIDTAREEENQNGRIR
jgi:hypothetical protein